MLDKIDQWEGAAAACLAAVLGAIVLTRPDIKPDAGMLYWLVFVGICGLCFNIRTVKKLGDLALMALFPALALILALVFRGALDLMAGAVFLSIASIGQMPANAATVVQAGALYFAIFVFTIPAIMAAAFARGTMVTTFKTLLHLDPKVLTNLEKVINTGIRIGTILIGVVIYRAT